MRTLLYFLLSCASLALATITQVPSDKMISNVRTYIPALPDLPPWITSVIFAISVMAATIFLGVAILRFASRPPEVVREPSPASRLMAKYQAGEWQPAYPPLKRDQALLDEISDLKAPLAALRIEMEQDFYGRRDVEYYKTQCDSIREEVASKIKGFAGRAEANNYRTCGNLDRRLGSIIPHQLYIDILTRDLDYLDRFIEKHSR